MKDMVTSIFCDKILPLVQNLSLVFPEDSFCFFGISVSFQRWSSWAVWMWAARSWRWSCFHSVWLRNVSTQTGSTWLKHFSIVHHLTKCAESIPSCRQPAKRQPSHRWSWNLEVGLLKKIPWFKVFFLSLFELFDWKELQLYFENSGAEAKIHSLSVRMPQWMKRWPSGWD